MRLGACILHHDILPAYTSAASAEAAALPALTDTSVIAGFIKENARHSCVDAPDAAVASTCRYQVCVCPAVPLLSESCVPLVVVCQP